MNEIRKKKLEGAILRELSLLIIKQRVKDDRIGLVSVTEVALDPDMRAMSVYISPFGADEENKFTWDALVSHAAWFQTQIGRNLRLRQTPHLNFKIDNRIKEGDRILDRLESS